MNNFFQFLYDYRADLYRQTIEHLGLTFASLLFALLLSIPLAIFLTRRRAWANLVIGLVGVIQTIPSIALLGLLLPLLGIGTVPAIVALFLYALLPIVRNTYSGILEVDQNVKEAAKGMGLSSAQILTKVELPLAMPVIFAGVRTATVINVGVATLSALIGAGGLGEFIFRGISLNNMTMLLAGAIPAAILALLLDFLLGLIENMIRKKPRSIIPLLIGIMVLISAFYLFQLFNKPSATSQPKLRGGFVAEFMNREDGYLGLKKHYDLALEGKQFESGLMFQALINGDVDIISGYATDGRIEAEKLKILEDDKLFFPPYAAAPVINEATDKEYPELARALNLLAGRLDNKKMARLNYEVDFKKRLPKEVARDFLIEEGFEVGRTGDGKKVIRVGSKSFTEQYILANMFKILIENNTDLTVESKIGMASTTICFEALKSGEIDVYPEYTGTGLLVLIQPEKAVLDTLGFETARVYHFVKEQSLPLFGMKWLQPLGFSNSWAMMMREGQANELGIHSISDLKAYIDQTK
jgi:osmoprotectant transport system permease protein